MIPEWVSGAFQFLVDMNMHPMVTLVISMIMIVGRVQWEQFHIDAAKNAITDAAKATPDIASTFLSFKLAEEKAGREVSNRIALLAMLCSVFGQIALYWPRSGQAIALCAFFSVAQFCLAKVISYYFFELNIPDILGRYFKRKADGVGVTP